ncbi:MAG: PHP domain-containing protein [Chloroflexi bacterium]|nr:PHP domain-containing protein [Chloroflexota bacterium]
MRSNQKETEHTMGLADLHIHTIYSYDGTATVAAVLRRAKEIGLDVIAITDHDEIAGAQEAMTLASHYGIEVIPGCEITTAEGDLLAYYIKEKIKPGLSLVETLLRVRDQGGVAIAAHPMAGGMGMKSLKPYSILKALKHKSIRKTLIGIEAYNGTSIDRMSNRYAQLFANGIKLAHTGNSDAHVIDTIGFGATEFDGSTAADLMKSLLARTTRVRKMNEWSAFRVISSWGLRYIESSFARFSLARP